MKEEILFQRDKVLVRRMRLEPQEAMPWHVDPFHRVTLTVQGESLAIEYRDGERREFDVRAGEVDQDEPTDRPHRGVNVATVPYEEVTIFFLDRAGAPHQPPA